MKRTLMIAVSAGLVLGGCAKTQTIVQHPGAPGSPTPVVSTVPPSACPTIGNVAAKSAEAIGAMLLTGVRVAGHGCSDRVVFEFRQQRGKNGTPGYNLGYKKGPFTQDPSDKPMTVDGSAFLFLRIEPASGADQTQPTPSPTYTGSEDIKPTDTSHVAEAEERGDFEGVMTWVIGLKTQRPFTTSVLRSATTIKLVIDIN